MNDNNHPYLKYLGQAPRELTYNLNEVSGEFFTWRARWHKNKRLYILFDVEIPMTYERYDPTYKGVNKRITNQFQLSFSKRQCLELIRLLKLKINQSSTQAKTLKKGDKE